MTEITFIVPGKPTPKGRPRFTRVGNYVKTYTPEKTAVFENMVALCYEAACRKAGEPGFLFDGPIAIEVHCYFRPPKSASKKARAAMLSGETKYTKKPDADNIFKAVTDGCNAVAYRDDSQIVRIAADKSYADYERTEVTITQL